MKNTYTLFSRKMSDGTAAWYYRVYDEKGRRRAFATGQRTKTAASTYCNSSSSFAPMNLWCSD